MDTQLCKYAIRNKWGQLECGANENLPCITQKYCGQIFLWIHGVNINWRECEKKQSQKKVEDSNE